MQEQDVIKTSQKYITWQILKINKNGKKEKKKGWKKHCILQFIDDKKARQHRAWVKHQQLAVVPTHRVEPEPDPAI